MLFILTVHSYLFLPYLCNLSHRLTELNFSLFCLIYLIFFQKYLTKQPHVNVKAIKLSFIQQVCLQNLLIKEDDF